MLVKYSPPSNCSIYDLVIQIYTNLDLLSKFIIDNNIQEYDLITDVGESYIYDTDFIFDELIYSEIISNKYLFSTGITYYSPNITNKDVYLDTEDSDDLNSEAPDDFIL